MKSAEQLKATKGDRVRYRGFEMVVVSVARRMEPGVPFVFALGWPEQPDRPVYPSILARLVTKVDK